MSGGFNLEDYNTVAERIIEFREKHPEGSLRPLNPAQPYDVVAVAGKMFIAYVAAAYRTPDDPCPGVGTAWEPVPGPSSFTRDSELQNAETAAWGRAIVAALAADTRKGVASRDEVQARNTEPLPDVMATEPQLQAIDDWLDQAEPVRKAEFMEWRQLNRIPARKHMTAPIADLVLKHMRFLDESHANSVVGAPAADEGGDVSATSPPSLLEEATK
jgi:hypothetical protein